MTQPIREDPDLHGDIYKDGKSPPDEVIEAGTPPSATYAEAMSWPRFKSPYLETRKKIRAMREAARAWELARGKPIRQKVRHEKRECA